MHLFKNLLYYNFASQKYILFILKNRGLDSTLPWFSTTEDGPAMVADEMTILDDPRGGYRFFQRGKGTETWNLVNMVLREV